MTKQYDGIFVITPPRNIFPLPPSRNVFQILQHDKGIFLFTLITLTILSFSNSLYFQIHTNSFLENLWHTFLANQSSWFKVYTYGGSLHPPRTPLKMKPWNYFQCYPWTATMTAIPQSNFSTDSRQSPPLAPGPVLLMLDSASLPSQPPRKTSWTPRGSPASCGTPPPVGRRVPLVSRTLRSPWCWNRDHVPASSSCCPQGYCWFLWKRSFNCFNSEGGN